MFLIPFPSGAVENLKYGYMHSWLMTKYCVRVTVSNEETGAAPCGLTSSSSLHSRAGWGTAMVSLITLVNDDDHSTGSVSYTACSCSQKQKKRRALGLSPNGPSSACPLDA